MCLKLLSYQNNVIGIVSLQQTTVFRPRYQIETVLNTYNTLSRSQSQSQSEKIN